MGKLNVLKSVQPPRTEKNSVTPIAPSTFSNTRRAVITQPVARMPRLTGSLYQNFWWQNVAIFCTLYSSTHLYASFNNLEILTYTENTKAQEIFLRCMQVLCIPCSVKFLTVLCTVLVWNLYNWLRKKLCLISNVSN